MDLRLLRLSYRAERNEHGAYHEADDPPDY
jgi:hypothetical protein